MAFDSHSNFAYSVITAAPAPATSGTSITVADGSVFPAVPFNVTIWEVDAQPLAANAEIVRVTNRVGNVLTITRAQEGTTARTIVVGDQIAATITVRTVTDIEGAIPSTAGLISAINVSAGALSQNLSAITFSNANGVSFGLAGSVVTATVATNYQSSGAYLTTAALSQDSSKYAGTNGAITGGSLTVNTSGVSINLPAYLTTAMQSNAVTLSNIRVSAGASSDYLSAVTFSNSNGLAFGLNAGTITGSYTVPAAQTGISGLIASDATYTSGTVRFSGVGGGVTVNSNTGQRVDISVAAPVAQSVQTQNMVALSLSGNTAGVLALVSSGTAYIAGGNNITVSQNGQSITISGANAGGAQTAISGIIVSDATYTSGTVSFSNAGNITIASSVNGATQYIKLSGNAAQTTQSAIKAFGVSNTGQTAGNTGVSTGVDWVLAGSGSITLSQSTAGGGPNTVWMQHPAWLTTAALSQDSSKYAGTNGAITGGSITVNTSGVSINLPAYLTTADLSANSSKYVQEWALTGNTAGTTSSAQGTRLYFSGGNSITISGSSNSLVFSVGNYLTTAALSADSSKYAGTNGAITGGSITVNTSGVSVNLPAYISTQSTQFLALTLGGNSLGTSTFHATNNASIFLNGGNNITLSGNGSTITISAAAQTNQSAIKAFGVSNTGQTAGNTGVSTGIDWVLAGSGSITLSQSTAGGGPNTVWMQHPAWLTTAMASNRGSDFVQATAGFNGTNASGTIASNSISVSVAAPIPIATIAYDVASANSTGTVTRYAPEDHRHAGIGALGISTAGNTAGTTGSVQGTYWVQGGANLTVSQITSNNGSHTLVLSAGSAAASPVNFSAGTTSGNIGSVVFSNSNGVSFGLNGSTITGTVSTYDTVGTATTVKQVSFANSVGTIARWAAEDHAHAGVGALGISTGNTSGTTGSVQGTYWFQGSNNLTVSQITSNNGSHTLVLNASVPSASLYAPEWAFSGKATNSSLGQSTVYFQPFDLPFYLSASRINFYVSLSGAMSAGNSTGTCSAGIGYGIYTLNTGANSQTLSLLTSYSLQIYSLSFTSNTVFAATYYAGLSNATSHTTAQTVISNANATTFQATNLNGPRVIAMPLGVTMTPGRYYLGVSVQTVTGNALTNNISVFQTSVGVQPAVYPMGTASAATNASVFGPEQGWGFYSAQTAGFPATLAFTTDHIRRAAAAQTLVPFEIAGYGTSTNII